MIAPSTAPNAVYACTASAKTTSAEALHAAGFMRRLLPVTPVARGQVRDERRLDEDRGNVGCLQHGEPRLLDAMPLAERKDFDRRSMGYDRELQEKGHYVIAEDGAITIIQPDLSKTGGITEIMRIAAMASGWRSSRAPRPSSRPHGSASTAGSCPGPAW